MTTQSGDFYTLYAEFTSGSSNKFYRVTVSGNQLTCHWGRIGTAGQMQVKDFRNHLQAMSEASRKMTEKTAKGYVITFNQQYSRRQPPTPVEEAPTVRRREVRKRTPEPAPVKRVEPAANGSANVVFFLD